MKKIIALLATTVLTATVAFAEIHPFYRFFEIAVNGTIFADENLLTVPEVFTKNVVIDLTKLADSMGSEGMVIDAGGGADVGINFNFGKKAGFGIDLDVDASSRMSIGKDLFDLLGYGNKLDEKVSTTLNLGTEMYVEASVPIKMTFGRVGVKITPSYFVPVIYIPQPSITVSAVSNSDGTMTANLNGEFSVYSLVDQSNAFDDESNFLGINSLIAPFKNVDNLVNGLQSGGFDLNAEVEYPLFRTFDVGVYTRIPVVPGKLPYSVSGTVAYSAQVDAILDSLSSGNSVSTTTDGPTFSKLVFNSNSYSVNRPLRLGVEGAWRPFGKWCTFLPSVGLGARNPFGEDFNWATSMYPEYNLGVDMRFFYVLGLNFATSYQKQIFVQSVGLVLNLRVVEIDVTVASCSANFLKSWGVCGINAIVGIKVGF